MKLGPPILRTDRHRQRRPTGPAPTVVVEEDGPDLTTIVAPIAETLAGAQEGATRA